MKEVLKIFDAFYGGIQSGDKSNVVGAVSNAEEVDIFSNKNYVQAEQILSADSIPAESALYAYDVAKNDVLYGYGKNTTNDYVRIFKLDNSGAVNPTDWATLFTSSSADVANALSPIVVHEITESAAQKTYLYYIAGTNKLKKYGPLESSPSESDVGTLSGLEASGWNRPWMLRLYGELYIGHGQYIAFVDDDGTFTEKKFTLPNGWKGVSGVGLSDSMLILCQNVNYYNNFSMIYKWDLVASSQFDDSILIPMGGPQWIINHKEAIRVLCAINGKAYLFQLSASYPVLTHIIENVATETTSQPISPVKCTAQKNGVLYFGLWKTDKSGIYALGQVAESTPYALVLSKRFNTTDYSKHYPTALFIQGQNFYASYIDNTTQTYMRCEGANSPSRSSNAVIETMWYDAGDPLIAKDLTRAYLTSYPLPANTSLKLYVATDYTATYTEIKRPNDSIFNDANGIFGLFKPSAFANKRAFKVKVEFISSTTNSPKLQTIGLRVNIKERD